MSGGADVLETISRAMERKDVVGIRYHGGSNPGAYREIRPLKITKTGKLQAKCLLTNAVKFFVFANIELAEAPDTAGS
jgi:predicted DNA-binding transcriptional regulator YafY